MNTFVFFKFRMERKPNLIFVLYTYYMIIDSCKNPGVI